MVFLVKKFTIRKRKSKKNRLEIHIKDDSTGKKTKIFLSDARIEHPNDVCEISDTPQTDAYTRTHFTQIEAKGEDGNSYWVTFLTDEQSKALSTEFYADELEPEEEIYSVDDTPLMRDEAEIAEQAGRYEDAAEIYENLSRTLKDKKLLDKARKLRTLARRVPPVKVITVDVNKLIQQLREDGLVVAYSCPRCGGKLKISGGTKPESLKFCSYCGSKLDTMDLAEFLRTTLS